MRSSHTYLRWMSTLMALRRGPNHRQPLWALVIALAVLLGGDPTMAADAQGFTNRLGMSFVRIAAGSFIMGSPETERGRHHTETPHRVVISTPFYLQATEVTQAQWTAVMGNNPSEFKDPERPVEGVSWTDAQAFLRALNELDAGRAYRLPSEAEWEYAARAGNTGAFYAGNEETDLAAHAWYGVNADGRTHPVGTRRPNRWGLYDMQGNVWEWVQDWYGAYGDGRLIDPAGPLSGVIRVRRGCGWMSSIQSCRLASRSGNLPDYRVFAIGLRVVCARP